MRKKRGSKVKLYIFVYSMVAWPVLHWLVFTLYMNIKTVSNSFYHWNQYLGTVQFAKFDNYANFFNKLINNYEDYGLAFKNALLFIPFNLFILIPVSLMVSYALTKKIPFKKAYTTVYFIPNVISIVALTLAWAFMWDPNRGVVNSLLGMVGLESLQRVWLGSNDTALTNIFLYCLWAGIGWNNLVFTAAMSNISSEIHESAVLDGITPIKEFFKITIPLIWPTISTLIILGTAGSFAVFLPSKLLTNGQYGTMTIALRIVNTVLAGDYGLASASGIIIGIIGFIVTYIIKTFIDKVDNHWA